MSGIDPDEALDERLKTSIYEAKLKLRATEDENAARAVNNAQSGARSCLALGIFSFILGILSYEDWLPDYIGNVPLAWFILSPIALGGAAVHYLNLRAFRFGTDRAHMLSNAGGIAFEALMVVCAAVLVAASVVFFVGVLLLLSVTWKGLGDWLLNNGLAVGLLLVAAMALTVLLTELFRRRRSKQPRDIATLLESTWLTMAPFAVVACVAFSAMNLNFVIGIPLREFGSSETVLWFEGNDGVTAIALVIPVLAVAILVLFGTDKFSESSKLFSASPKLFSARLKIASASVKIALSSIALNLIMLAVLAIVKAITA
jgi:hypothetical protein